MARKLYERTVCISLEAGSCRLETQNGTEMPRRLLARQDARALTGYLRPARLAGHCLDGVPIRSIGLSSQGERSASLCIFLNLTSAANTKDCVAGQGAFSPCRAPCESFGVRIDASIPRPGLWRNPQNFLAPELAQDSHRTVP